MWSLLLGVLGGALGWIATRLFFDPFKEIADLRRETQERLILFGNVSSELPESDEWRLAACDAFRRTGSGLIARHLAAYPWVGYCLLNWWPRWDIHTAGAALLSLGNSLRDENTSMVDFSPTVRLIREKLKLPLPAALPIRAEQ
jgi:hypothetical protein